jgi:LemA protein
MGTIEIILIICIAIAVIIIGSIIVTYNNLITLKNRFKNAFAQISVQLQRRYDLIPNLVETAKKYMQYEQETLTKVINARNMAVDANRMAGANPADPNNINALASAETGLTKTMGNFFALMENYPDLKANTTMQQLMEELTSTENKIAFSRQGYNDSVMFYNTAREQFPNSIIANMFNFEPATLLELDNPEAAKPVKVSFN